MSKDNITITPANAGVIIKALRQAATIEKANGLRARELIGPGSPECREMRARAWGWFRLANEIEEQIT